MLNADTAPYFQSCPRCGVGGLENLETSTICYNCNYSPDLDVIATFDIDHGFQIPLWAQEAIRSADREARKYFEQKSKLRKSQKSSKILKGA